jgi:hypothetical protein
MALSADDLDYLNFALSALPSWMNASDEFLHGAAKLFGTSVKGQIDYWFGQTLIKNALGATGTTPDWLNQHARDRGTSRQNGETDVALRARLRAVSDAITRQALLSAANAILAASSIAGSAAMIELPRDAAHCGAFSSDTGTGGTFATNGVSPGFQFTPTVPFAAPPYRDPSVVRLVQSYSITIAGAASGANNGTFTITGLNVNAAKYNNGAGVAGADAGVTWTINKLDRRGNALNGHGKSFASRGFRCTHVGRPTTFLIILPYGSTTGTIASVRAMLSQKKAAGILAIVERRLNP